VGNRVGFENSVGTHPTGSSGSVSVSARGFPVGRGSPVLPVVYPDGLQEPVYGSRRDRLQGLTISRVRVHMPGCRPGARVARSPSSRFGAGRFAASQISGEVSGWTLVIGRRPSPSLWFWLGKALKPPGAPVSHASMIPEVAQNSSRMPFFSLREARLVAQKDSLNVFPPRSRTHKLPPFMTAYRVNIFL